LVVSTHLKNISQIGNLPQIGVKIKNVYPPLPGRPAESSQRGRMPPKKKEVKPPEGWTEPNQCPEQALAVCYGAIDLLDATLPFEAVQSSTRNDLQSYHQPAESQPFSP